MIEDEKFYKKQFKENIVDPKPIDIAEPIKEQPIEGVVLTPEDTVVPTMQAKPKRKKTTKESK
jgi:hypothetical protein